MTDQANRQFWDRVADKYAARPVSDSAAYDAMLADVATRLKPTDRVLEIGCGTGSTAIRLGGGVALWRATDFSAEMVRIARAKVAPDSVRFVQAEAEAAFAEGPYDAVCAFHVLHLVQDARTTLETIHANLKPGGLLISKTWCFADLNFLMRRALLPALQRFGMMPQVKALAATDLRRTIAAAGFAIDTQRSFGKNRHSLYVVAHKSP